MTLIGEVFSETFTVLRKPCAKYVFIPKLEVFESSPPGCLSMGSHGILIRDVRWNQYYYKPHPHNSWLHVHKQHFTCIKFHLLIHKIISLRCVKQIRLRFVYVFPEVFSLYIVKYERWSYVIESMVMMHVEYTTVAACVSSNEVFQNVWGKSLLR
jgi:hypothetical protein